MSHTLWIPGVIPGWNELLEASNRIAGVSGRSGRRWNGYTELKRSWTARVTMLARAQDFEPITRPAWFHFEFYEESRRRDPFNFVGGAIKIIPDALQDAGLLPNDGWKQVLGWTQKYFVLADRGPGVLLHVKQEEPCQTERSPEPSRNFPLSNAS